MSKSKFYDKIVVAKEEREVEDVYNEREKYWKNVIHCIQRIT